MTTETASLQSRRHRRVRFRIRDVYFPSGEKVLEELHGNDVLEGNVVSMSESGPQGETYVVVEVDGLEQPVVVPRRCTQEPS